jgi:hypothetical protein
MLTLDGLKKKEEKLRALHAQQTAAGQRQKAQTTRRKLIAALNQIKDLEDRADTLLPEK